MADVDYSLACNESLCGGVGYDQDISSRPLHITIIYTGINIVNSGLCDSSEMNHHNCQNCLWQGIEKGIIIVHGPVDTGAVCGLMMALCTGPCNGASSKDPLLGHQVQGGGLAFGVIVGTVQVR